MRYTYFVLFLFAFLGVGCSAPQTPAASAVPVQPTAAVAASVVVVEPTVGMVEPTVVPVDPTANPVPTDVPVPPTAASVPAQEPTADPFDVSVGQYYLDSAGFQEMATVLSDTQALDLSFRTRVARIKKVLAQMPLPVELEAQGQAFNQTLENFSLAMRDNEVQDAIALGSEVQNAQVALSQAIDAWLETRPVRTETADPFNVSLAQYYVDTLGFHDMATVLSDTQKMDPTFLSTATRVEKVLAQATWAPDITSQAEAFMGAMDAFTGALRAEDVGTAITASETVHEAQHELSHAIDAWLESKPAGATAPSRLQISIAQYYLDSAGFHDMAEALAENDNIEPDYRVTVNRVARLLGQATWPAVLAEPAGAFVEQLDALALALQAEDVPTAITLSDTVHDAQHDFSHAIDQWLGGEAVDH